MKARKGDFKLGRIHPRFRDFALLNARGFACQLLPYGWHAGFIHTNKVTQLKEGRIVLSHTRDYFKYIHTK